MTATFPHEISNLAGWRAFERVATCGVYETGQSGGGGIQEKRRNRGGREESGSAILSDISKSYEIKQARTKVLLNARVVVLVARFVAVGATVRDAVRLAAVPGRHSVMIQSVAVNVVRRVCCTYGILSGRLAGMGLEHLRN